MCPPATARCWSSEESSVCPDNFQHEQSLIIQEDGKVFVIGGCGHRGIINIMRQANFITGKHLNAVVSGFHLVDRCCASRKATHF